jgi:hypothetical protein
VLGQSEANTGEFRDRLSHKGRALQTGCPTTTILAPPFEAGFWCGAHTITLADNDGYGSLGTRRRRLAKGRSSRWTNSMEVDGRFEFEWDQQQAAQEPESELFKQVRRWGVRRPFSS